MLGEALVSRYFQPIVTWLGRTAFIASAIERFLPRMFAPPPLALSKSDRKLRLRRRSMIGTGNVPVNIAILPYWLQTWGR